MVSNEEDIQESLKILLSTSLGERVMQPDYGCDLNNYLFEEISYGIITRLKTMLSKAILNHEPRINVGEIIISESKEVHGLLLININYIIKSTNSRDNMVYPFYINEATNL